MTPFGKVMTNLRIDFGLSVKDLAELMGNNPAYISAVEHGRKGKPSDRFIEAVCRALELTEEQRQELEEAAEKSAPVLKIEKVSKPAAYEIANLLVKHLPDLGSGTLKRIRDLIREDTGAEKREVPGAGSGFPDSQQGDVDATQELQRSRKRVV